MHLFFRDLELDETRYSPPDESPSGDVIFFSTTVFQQKKHVFHVQ